MSGLEDLRKGVGQGAHVGFEQHPEMVRGNIAYQYRFGPPAPPLVGRYSYPFWPGLFRRPHNKQQLGLPACLGCERPGRCIHIRPINDKVNGMGCPFPFLSNLENPTQRQPGVESIEFLAQLAPEMTWVIPCFQRKAHHPFAPVDLNRRGQDRVDNSNGRDRFPHGL